MASPLKVSSNETSSHKPPLSMSGDVPCEEPLVLSLTIEDHDLGIELRRREEGSHRNSFALSALRIGVLAIRQAQGHVDAEIVRTEGQRLLGELNRELSLGIQEIDNRIGASLKLYFDPQSGHFTERVERLVRKDGDLERVLRSQVGDGENSELARTLARRIGDSSPLMRRLDPQDAEGIARSIENSVKEVFDLEQRRLLNEFSLDNESGAVARLIHQVRSTNHEFRGDIEQQLKIALKEFSLDDENSALSRLVKRVEKANEQITDEFSTENEESAINKLNAVLEETRRSIDDNLTLDNEMSALARLKRQLTDVLGEMRDNNQRFQQDVSAKLASLITKHQEEMRSTTHGLSFEEEFCAFLQAEAQKAGDVFSATGSIPGAIPRCKIGDAVIELAPEGVAAGERIVFEAKSKRGAALNAARKEIEQARRNRQANVGVFVFAKGSAPHGIPPFARIDRDIFVVWDAADSSTDIYLSAAISVGKAILFRQKTSENKAQGDILAIERALNILEKQLQGLDEVESWTNTIQSNASKVTKRIMSIRERAHDQIEQLRTFLGVLAAE